ncbi:MAG: UDP-3-O-(3-hydroxymyristoyl)glucosamine N-acyltransferase [Desulfamplus sp.]|nr:UDP-3-O-(3-hydroxymyristoyl)glucosamine N-acyltransferase [Desulfamplus sp.]
MELTLKYILEQLENIDDISIEKESLGEFHSLGIQGCAPLKDAGPGEITFASESRFFKYLNTSRAAAVVVPLDAPLPAREENFPVFIRTDNPKRLFFRILSLFHPRVTPSFTVAPGVVKGDNFVAGDALTIESHVAIGNNVSLGRGVHIMPGVYIGDNVIMGDDVIVKPNVTIMEGSRIGSRVVIHSGSVIGSDGYGFTPDMDSGHEKIPHAGFVHIGDDVEIGACNTIDRGTFGCTSIGRGVKTDNLVHIAHNVIIGDYTLIVAQVGIAGSTTIGKGVIIAGKAGISGHLNIGDRAVVGPGAGVLGHVKPGETVSGIPEMPHRLWLKVARILPRLPELRKKILALEKKVASMTK